MLAGTRNTIRFGGNRINLFCLLMLVICCGCAGREIRKNNRIAGENTSNNESRSRYNQGVAAYRARDLEIALENFQNAQEHSRDPQLIASAKYNIGMIWLEKGDLESAKKILMQVLKIKPTHLKALINFGVVLEKMGLYAHAVTHYRKALKLHPENRDILGNLMVVLRLHRQFSQAEQIGHQLLASEPDNLRVRNNLGMVYLDWGKLDLAESIFLGVLERLGGYGIGDPDLELVSKVQNNVGVVYRRMQKAEKALEHFKKALDADPNNPQALLNLAWLYGDYCHYKRAITPFQQVVDQQPDHHIALKGLGIAYYGAGMPEKAVEYLKRAVQIDPQDAQVYFILGEIQHRLLRDVNLAIKYYKEYKSLRGRSLQPDDPVHQRLQELEK